MSDVKEIKKIDIHVHATAFPQFYPHFGAEQRLTSAEEIIDFYDQIGVEKGVILPLVSPERQISLQTSEETKLITQKYPERFLWFCNVDPRAVWNTPESNLTDLIAFYKNLGAKGVGEITANMYMDDIKVDMLFSACEELDMPVTIHIAPSFESYGLVDELGLPRLEKILKKHPDLKILGHSQPFWSEISADNNESVRNSFPNGKVTEGRIACLMREYGNLYCDISAGSGLNAISRDTEYTARFFEEFSDRILFGTDICAPTNTHQFASKSFFDKFLDDGMISEENYIKLIRANAEKLLKLNDK